jgi:hypothetical protein
MHTNSAETRQVAGVTVLSPNGGEDWRVGTAQTISWADSGVANVKIECTTDNGTSWTTIVASTPGASGNFAWTVPNTLSEQCKVKISDVSNGAVSDASDDVFFVTLPLRISYGTTGVGHIGIAGEMDSYTFSASANDVVTVRMDGGSLYFNPQVELYSPDGTLLQRVAGYGTTTPSARIDTVRIPRSGICTILAMDRWGDRIGPYGMSVQLVSAPGSGQLITYGTSKQGDISIKGQMDSYTFSASANDVVTVRMDGGTLYFNPQVELYSPDGTLLQRVAGYGTTTPSARIDTVRIPRSGICTILAMDKLGDRIGPYGMSVQLVSAPGSGQLITYGTSKQGDISIKGQMDSYTFNANANDIVTVRMGGGSLYFTPQVELYSPTGALLQRTSSSSTAKIDTLRISTGGRFTILAMDASGDRTATYGITLIGIAAQNFVSLISPNGGESLSPGSSVNVTWMSNNITNVQLEYTTDNGTAWQTIIASTAASSSSYAWMVPNTSSINCRVKISDASNPTYNDMSDGLFTILSSSTPAPSAMSTAASGVTSTSGILKGLVNPNGLATTAYFEWGTGSTLSPSSSTESQSIGSGTNAISVTATLTGLTPSTMYYYRIVGQNIGGTIKGSILSFSTFATPLLGEYTSDASTVLLLHMHEASGSTIRDASAFGNDGTATGTTIVGGRFGKSRSLNGSSDFIVIPASVSTSVAGSITLEAWIRPAASNIQPIIEYNDDAQWGAHLWQNDQFTKLWVNFADVSSKNSIAMSTSNDILASNWCHVAATYDKASGIVSLYVNGKMVGQQNVGTITPQTSYKIYLGARTGGGSARYYGTIDEVRISSKARSPEEFNLQLPPKNLSASASAISLTWQNGGGAVPLMRYKIYRGTDSTNVSPIDSTTTLQYSSSGLSAATKFFYRVSAVDSTGFEGAKSWAINASTGSQRILGEYTPDANTVLLLHMNETSGSTATDASSFGNSGAVTGASIASGRFGNARNFDGTSQYITIPANTSLNQSTYTLEAWIKIPFVSTFEQDIICKGPASDYELRLSNSKVTAILTNSNLSYPCLGKTVVTANAWHHVAATCDVSLGKLRVYLDGVKEKETDLPFMPSVKDGQLVIGALYNANSLFFSGLIDEVRISNKARSPQEFNLQLPPLNLSATSTGTAINLNWQNGGGAVPLMRYKIYRGTDSTSVSLVDSTTLLLYSNAGLTSGTKYFYRVSAVDSTGFEGSRSYTASAVFGPAPVVTTTAATTISTTSATLNGSVNPNGLATTGWFEWGVDSLFRAYSSTASQSIGSGTSAIPVTANLTGLNQNRTYYYRVVAQNSVGTTSGSVVSFATSAPLPAATTLAASSVALNSAVLNGNVNPSGALTTASFEWGTVSTLSSYTATSSQSIGSGSTDVPVTANLPGLTSNTTHYYRVVGQNSGGTQKGTIVSFTTLATSPVLTSPANLAVSQAIPISFSWGTLVGVSYHLQVALGSTFASPLAFEDTAIVSSSRQVSSIAQNTTYYWRVRAKNAGGYGAWSTVYSFTTIDNKTVTSPGISYPASPTASTDYRLVSFPGTSTMNVGQVLTGAQNSDWRMFSENGSTGSASLTELSSTSNLRVGEGYWLINKGTLSFSRLVTMPAISSDGSYSISVRSGWNIVGNPFDVAVQWATVKQDNGISSTLWTYGGTAGFQSVTTLEPFKGYYVSLGSTNLKIRYPFVSSKVTETPPPAIDWKLQLVLATDANTDAENYIGIAPSADSEREALNQPEPPSVFDQAFLRFVRKDAEGVIALASSDFRRSVGDGQVWTVEVVNPKRANGGIEIKGIESVPSEYEVVLIDTRGTSPVDVRRTNEISLAGTDERMQYDLIVGKSAFVDGEKAKYLPTGFELSQNYPNPFNPRTTISYQLPAPSARQTASGLGVEGSASSLVTLRIYDVLGKEIATLVNGRQEAGRYAINWDASGFPSGVYLYQLTAAPEKGELFNNVKRMLLLK